MSREWSLQREVAPTPLCRWRALLDAAFVVVLGLLAALQLVACAPVGAPGPAVVVRSSGPNVDAGVNAWVELGFHASAAAGAECALDWFEDPPLDADGFVACTIYVDVASSNQIRRPSISVSPDAKYSSCRPSSNRFQIVALDGMNHLQGYWAFRPHKDRSGIWIESRYTWVRARERRNRVGERLWLAGVARWRPWQIRARLASYAGTALVARMAVVLAGRVSVWVEDGDWTQLHIRLVADAATRELGLRNQHADAQLQLEAPKLRSLAVGS